MKSTIRLILPLLISATAWADIDTQIAIDVTRRCYETGADAPQRELFRQVYPGDSLDPMKWHEVVEQKAVGPFPGRHLIYLEPRVNAGGFGQSGNNYYINEIDSELMRVKDWDWFAGTVSIEASLWIGRTFYSSFDSYGHQTGMKMDDMLPVIAYQSVERKCVAQDHLGECSAYKDFAPEMKVLRGSKTGPLAPLVNSGGNVSEIYLDTLRIAKCLEDGIAGL